MRRLIGVETRDTDWQEVRHSGRRTFQDGNQSVSSQSNLSRIERLEFDAAH